MPKRVIDFDAMWGSDKLASCAVWAQAEYAWADSLADASGCFEVTNLRVIWGAWRPSVGILRLSGWSRCLRNSAGTKGCCLFGSTKEKVTRTGLGAMCRGIAAPSWRSRLEKFAPSVPKKTGGVYGAVCAGRAAMAGGDSRLGRGKHQAKAI